MTTNQYSVLYTENGGMITAIHGICLTEDAPRVVEVMNRGRYSELIEAVSTDVITILPGYTGAVHPPESGAG